MRPGLKVVALPALALLAACGSSASSNASSGTGSGGGGVSLEVRDYAFSPATVAAKTGDKVTVTIHNAGNHTHNFSISELGVSQDVPIGETRTVTFTASGTTNLQFFCRYHRSSGMVGTLDLGGGNTPGGGASPAPANSAPNYGSTY